MAGASIALDQVTSASSGLKLYKQKVTVVWLLDAIVCEALAERPCPCKPALAIALCV